MALTFTTLSAAVSVTDTSIVVASATSVAAGNILRVDGETMVVAKNYASGTTVPVLRGQDGTVTAAHISGAAVMNGIAAADFDPIAPGAFVMQPLIAGGVSPYQVTATGATGATAAAIGPAPGIILATGASGAGIGLLKTHAVPGAFYIVKNMMTGALNLYAVGATINGTTGTTAVAITATGNLGGLVVCVNAGAWVVTPVPT